MDEELMLACKNPYYYKMNITDLKTRILDFFKELSENDEIKNKIINSNSRNYIAKMCRVLMKKYDINYQKSAKKGKIYSKSGQITHNNNQIAYELQGLKYNEWKALLKMYPSYNRTCHRKSVLKSIIIDDNDIDNMDEDDFAKFKNAENPYI